MKLQHEQAHNCQFCAIFLARKGLLNSHIDLVHTGIKYKCTGCGKLRQRINDCRKHVKKCKLSNIYAQIEKIVVQSFCLPGRIDLSHFPLYFTNAICASAFFDLCSGIRCKCFGRGILCLCNSQ
jgi:hypothetical protein